MQSTSCNLKVKVICGPDYEKEDLVWCGRHLGTVSSYQGLDGQTRWKIGDQEFKGDCFVLPFCSNEPETRSQADQAVMKRLIGGM